MNIIEDLKWWLHLIKVKKPRIFKHRKYTWPSPMLIKARVRQYEKFGCCNRIIGGFVDYPSIRQRSQKHRGLPEYKNKPYYLFTKHKFNQYKKSFIT